MTVNLYQVGGKGNLFVDPPIIAKRDPTITDKIHPNGQVHPFNQMWINEITMPVIVWKYYGKLSNGDALWIQCNTSSAGAILTVETDDGAPFVVPDVNGNTQFIGGVGIDVTGTGPGNTVTITNTGEETNFTWQEVAVNTQTVVNNGYIVNDPGPAPSNINMTLPKEAAIGDRLCFIQKDVGTITILQNDTPDQQVHTILASTTAGSTGKTDTVDQWSSFCLICVTVSGDNAVDFSLEQGSHGSLLIV